MRCHIVVKQKLSEGFKKKNKNKLKHNKDVKTILVALAQSILLPVGITNNANNPLLTNKS